MSRGAEVNPLLAATGGEAGPKPRVPEVGERFRLHGSPVVYTRTEAGELRRATKKARGKAARRAEKVMRRKGKG